MKVRPSSVITLNLSAALVVTFLRLAVSRRHDLHFHLHFHLRQLERTRQSHRQGPGLIRGAGCKVGGLKRW